MTGEAICDDPDCLNRYVCADSPCEVYFDVRRESNGTVTHKPWEDEHPAINRHRMEKRADCSLLDFLNADRGMITELNEGDQEFVIGRTTIDPVWQGEDGALWKATVPAPTAN